MTEQEAIKHLKDILDEATTDENAVCYVTNCDEIHLKLAIEALEKQVPKKPIIYYACGQELVICGVCNMCSHITRAVDYCPHCGTKIDWGEE